MRRSWLREPLLHFFIAGAALFALYGWLDDGQTREGERVVRITAAQIEWLKDSWARQRQGPPSEDELEALIAGYVKEELLAHEAKELGLDEGDTVVRRRLAQKMEFLLDDTVRLDEPSDTELARFYEGVRDRYAIPARVSFAQVFFANEQRARDALPALAAGDGGEIGDPSLLESELVAIDQQSVTNLFGPDFAAAIFAFEVGEWHGPTTSPYGSHLVWIHERQAAQPRSFDEVEAQVVDDWYRQRHAEANERLLAALAEKYTVIVEDSREPPVGPLAEVAR